MNGLEQVKSAVANALEKAGLKTQAAFAPGWSRAYSSPVAAVGLRMGESRGGAFSSYLGQRVDPVTRAIIEVYGMRLELTLSLDLYCPPGEESGDSALEILHQVMLEGLPSGLKPTELKWEETRWDEDTSMFLRRGSLSCTAFFTADASEDGLMITDFILKGVVTK